MVTTLRELIQSQGMSLEETIYQGMNREALDFKLTVGDFFKAEKNTRFGENIYRYYAFYLIYQEAGRQSGVNRLEEQAAALGRQAAEIRRFKKGEEKEQLLRELKARKKPVLAEITALKEQCLSQARRALGGEPDKEAYLIYKDRAVVTDFINLCDMLPPLARMESAGMEKFPWLVCGLSKLRQMGAELPQPDALGLVGGPCLFGRDEVLLELQTGNGESRFFDLSCGRSCQKGGKGDISSEEDISLEEYLRHYSEKIKDVRLTDRKGGITKQEYISLKYLFEFAKALSGKAVVPLPDLSYLKYVEADTALMEEKFRSRTMGEFEKIAFRITDLYLEQIEELKRQYPSVEVKVLHARDKRLCRIFYEKREPYLQSSSYMRKLTGESGRKESVIDYITMLALPYYLYNTTNILQLDSMDETDSGRKCQKIHKGDIALSSILYPEFLSRDGIRTIYHAAGPYKEYR